ncbi:hypothetical protein AB0L40_06685 [Patulibacter sp. NPDC049589]|uniref:hypothetical protein n=1 Tax=Patulibacter sp. NPDC049589 TaxID=3154731 RepID=UPI003416ABAA
MERRRMTDGEQYRQLLTQAYDGERLGVVLGRELAARTDDAGERAVYHAFERVESVARAQLEPMIAAAGAAEDVLDEDAVERQGADLAGQMAAQPRTVAWTGILPEFERFIGHLERLRDLAPAGDRRPYNVLVDHEVASVAMVRAVIDDDLVTAERVLRGFLDAATS